MDRVLWCHSTQSTNPSADRQALTHLVELAEHGKPNCLHSDVESDWQQEPIGKWAEEVRESEGHLVMRWIGYYT